MGINQIVSLSYFDHCDHITLETRVQHNDVSDHEKVLLHHESQLRTRFEYLSVFTC